MPIMEKCRKLSIKSVRTQIYKNYPLAVKCLGRTPIQKSEFEPVSLFSEGGAFSVNWAVAPPG